jgi:TolB-like protein
MNKKTIISFLVLLLTATLTLTRAAAPQTLTVAVFDFESKDEAVRDLGPKVSTLLNATLSSEARLITVERAELDKVLSEQELGLSGTVSADTAARVGKIIGAKVLVTGRVMRTETELVIVAKVISAETSRVFGEMVQGAPNAAITGLATELAGKIVATITKNAEQLASVEVTREERLEKMKTALKGKHLPVVGVSITEQHVGRPVIDPAAETEVAHFLQDCGFVVVDEKSEQKPEFEIKGEAFSEFGLRKGNLQICRARVEIKVRERAAGQVVMVDRQTSVSVDIAEHTAAKLALQNAGLDLAERIALKLAK